MSDMEIRPDGEIRIDDLSVAQISAETYVLMDLVGVWWADGTVEGMAEEIEDLEERVKSVESDLESLKDEVRAFLAGKSTCPVAMERLSDALKAVE